MKQWGPNASIENYFIGDQYQCQTKCTAEGFWDETNKSNLIMAAKPVIDWIEATIDLSTFSSLLDMIYLRSFKSVTIMSSLSQSRCNRHRFR